MKLFRFPASTCLLPVTLFIATSCQQDEPLKSYAVNLKVEGSGLSQIYFRSEQENFDVEIVPRSRWSADVQLWGNDTILLHGSQASGSSSPVVVTIQVDHNQSPSLYYSDTGATDAEVTVFLPK